MHVGPYLNLKRRLPPTPSPVALETRGWNTLAPAWEFGARRPRKAGPACASGRLSPKDPAGTGQERQPPPALGLRRADVEGRRRGCHGRPWSSGPTGRAGLQSRGWGPDTLAFLTPPGWPPRSPRLRALPSGARSLGAPRPAPQPPVPGKVPGWPRRAQVWAGAHRLLPPRASPPAWLRGRARLRQGLNHQLPKPKLSRDLWPLSGCPGTVLSRVGGWIRV